LEKPEPKLLRNPPAVKEPWMKAIMRRMRIPPPITTITYNKKEMKFVKIRHKNY
jgi:hypothetical protein